MAHPHLAATTRCASTVRFNVGGRRSETARVLSGAGEKLFGIRDCLAPPCTDEYPTEVGGQTLSELMCDHEKGFSREDILSFTGDSS